MPFYNEGVLELRVCSFLKKIKNKSKIDSPGGAHLAQRDTVYSGK